MDILDTLDSIIGAKQAEPSSMQIFDAIALSARLDKQVKQIAEYIANSQAMTFSITTTSANTVVKRIANTIFCTIAVTVENNATTATITFANRQIWNARAFIINNGIRTNFTCAISDNVITIANCFNAQPITLQFY